MHSNTVLGDFKTKYCICEYYTIQLELDELKIIKKLPGKKTANIPKNL